MQHHFLTSALLLTALVRYARTADDDAPRSPGLVRAANSDSGRHAGLVWNPLLPVTDARPAPSGSQPLDVPPTTSIRRPSRDMPQETSLEQARRSGTWGPLQTGADNFAFHSYPLDLANLRHLYTRSDLTPVNFEDMMEETFTAGSTGPSKRRRLRSSGTIFYPEPALLESIQQHIWQNLRGGRIRPQVVDADRPLLEGQYLWPPVQWLAHPADGLGIESEILTTRLRTTVAQRVRAQSRDPAMPPLLYHMEVRVNGQTRHILMESIKAGHFVDHKKPPVDAKLWFLFEGMVQETQRGRRPRVAFLGATYLPGMSEEKLLEAGAIKPALEEYFRSLHG